MDMEVQRRIERLEQAINEEDRISRVERKTIRIGMLVIVSLTLLVIIVSKLSEVVHAVTTAWNSFGG
jgi:uncharacterized membrane protein